MQIARVGVLLALAGCHDGVSVSLDAAARDAPAADTAHASGGSDGLDASAADTGGPAPGPVRHARGGTRLKAHYLATAEGAAEFRYYWDQTLGIECNLNETEDKVLRCIPVSFGAASYYKDSACTQRVREIESGCAVSYGYVTNTQQSPIYRLGPPHKLAEVYVMGADHSCVRVPPERADADFADFTERVSPATFVAFGPAVPGRTFGRLTELVHKGEDGSVNAAYLRDNTVGPCRISTATDDTLRCLPDVATFTATYFADEACAHPLLSRAKGAPAIPGYALERLGQCEPRYRVWATGASHTGAIWQLQNGACAPLVAPPAVDLASLDHEVPPGDFVRFDRVPPAGRLDPRWVVSADGMATFTGSSLFDQRFGANCLFGRASDGRWRCFPRPSPRHFGDAACTQALGYVAASACAPAPDRAVVSVFGAAACDHAMRAFESDGREVTATYDLGLNGRGCSPSPGTTKYVGLGAEVPPEQLVEGVEEDE